LCDGANLVEVNGATVDPNSLIPGDTLALSVQPNALTDAKACIGRVVRQQVARAASAGECLQNFQVKQEIEGNPSPLFINTEYTYLLRVYARPTLDCDGKAYGTSPITTVVAPGKPFVVTLARGNGAVNLMQWSLSTDAAGRASFAYTFTEPANNYEFQITPGGGNTAGDAIGWSADLTDPNPSPSPTAEPTASGGSPLQLWPIAVVLVVVVIAVGAGLELRHLQRKRRSHELPEDEYRRTPRF
jgi:hypothetical protein